MSGSNVLAMFARKLMILIGLVGIPCGLAGCNNAQQYVDVYKEQRAAWKELVDILDPAIVIGVMLILVVMLAFESR